MEWRAVHAVRSGGAAPTGRGGGSGGSEGEVVLACAGACCARCSQRGRCSYRSRVAVVAGGRGGGSWLAVGRALRAVRSGGPRPRGAGGGRGGSEGGVVLAGAGACFARGSQGGAAPTGWGRRVGVEWGCCPYG